MHSLNGFSVVVQNGKCSTSVHRTLSSQSTSQPKLSSWWLPTISTGRKSRLCGPIKNWTGRLPATPTRVPTTARLCATAASTWVSSSPVPSPSDGSSTTASGSATDNCGYFWTSGNRKLSRVQGKSVFVFCTFVSCRVVLSCDLD